MEAGRGCDSETRDIVLVLLPVICVALRKPQITCRQPQFANSKTEVREWIPLRGGEAHGKQGFLTGQHVAGRQTVLLCLRPVGHQTQLTYLPYTAGRRQGPHDRFHGEKLVNSPGLRARAQQRNLASRPHFLAALAFGHLPKGLSHVVSQPDNPSPSLPCNTRARMGSQAALERVCFLGSTWFWMT